MIELNDPKWKTLNGGYRLPYDGSVRLLELDSSSTNTEKIWEEFWNELHHQGGVDLASYAVVPQLVRICIKRQLLDWNVFALVATIEECRVFRENPKLPQWLEDDYHFAIKGLAEFGVKHFSENWPKELAQSFLAVAAFAKGLPKSARLLITFSDDELDEVFEKFFQ
jgi:hypothetical protein